MIRATLAAIVASSLPPAPLNAAEHSALVHRATDLVLDRVGRMDPILAFGIKSIAALFGIAAFVVLRHPLAHASDAERRRFIAAASRMPLVPFGDLVKLVRAFALLTYCDDSAVQARMGWETIQ